MHLTYKEITFFAKGEEGLIKSSKKSCQNFWLDNFGRRRLLDGIVEDGFHLLILNKKFYYQNFILFYKMHLKCDLNSASSFL